MPFLQTDEELEKQNNAGQISSPSAAPMASAAPQKAKAATSSGSWVNLQQYVNANKNQAGQMGQAIANTAEQAGQEAQNKLNDFTAKTPQKTQQYTAQDLENQYYSNPNANKEQYQNLKQTGGYSGPQSLEEAGYGAAESSVNKAYQAAQNLQTEQGRQQVLGEVYKKPSYTGGQKTFDNLLVQNDPNAQKTIKDATAKWGGLTNLLAGAKDTAAQVIPQNIATASTNAKTANQAEQDYVNKIYGDLETQAANINQANKSAADSLKSHLSSGNLTASDWQNLGLNTGDQYFNLNPADYVNYDNTTLTANDVADPSQRAAWSNLMNLIGGTDQRIGQAGKTINPAALNKEKFAADKAAQQEAFNNMAASTTFTPTRDKYVSGGTVSMQDYLNSGLSPEQFEQQFVGRPGTADQIKSLLQQYGYYNKVGGAAINDPILNTNNYISSGGITGGLKG